MATEALGSLAVPVVRYAHALGIFLSGMINVFNPTVIVFGGGISGAFRLFKPMVQAAIEKQAMWPQRKNVKLARARVKDPGIVGAGLYALQQS